MPRNLSSSFEIYKNLRNENHTLVTSVNEFRSVLSTFIFRFVLNYVQEIGTQCCLTF